MGLIVQFSFDLSFYPSSCLQPDDAAYLKQVHAHAIRERGLTKKHFEHFVKHWEETLHEMGSIIPKVCRGGR